MGGLCFPDEAKRLVRPGAVESTERGSVCAALEPIYIQRLRRRCVMAPKSNLLFWCCTVTPSDCDIAAMLLGNRFVSDWERRRSDIAVTRCKWALI